MIAAKKQFLTLALWSVLASANAFAADSKEMEALKQLERDWSAATVRHDPPVVERLLADDYVGIDGRGITTTKADEIAEAKGPDPSLPPPVTRVTAEEMVDLTVRLYGD